MTEAVMPGMEKALRPDLVSPVVAWLAHHECNVTGQTFSVGGGGFARVVIGLTDNVFDPNLTPEVVRDRLTDLLDASCAKEPDSAAAEMQHVLAEPTPE